MKKFNISRIDPTFREKKISNYQQIKYRYSDFLLKTGRHNRTIQKSELKTKKQDQTIKESELKTNRHNRLIQKSELDINRLYRPIKSEDQIGIGRSINRTLRPPMLPSYHGMRYLTVSFLLPLLLHIPVLWIRIRIKALLNLDLTPGFWCPEMKNEITSIF